MMYSSAVVGLGRIGCGFDDKLKTNLVQTHTGAYLSNSKTNLVALCDVGAYGMSLSSNYNVRPKPIELLIKGSKIKVIKKRQKHKDLI